MQSIKIVKLNPYTIIPHKGSEHAVGFDIHCNFFTRAHIEYTKNSLKSNFEDYLKEFSITLNPQSSIALETGVTLELPSDMEMDIKSRSGLFIKNGILAQGTIDPDYRGEVKIMLFNLGSQAFSIKHHERVAQAVFRKVYNQDNLFIQVNSINELTNTERSTGGFGSTGI